VAEPTQLLKDCKEFEKRLARYADRVIEGGQVSIFDIKRILKSVREIIAKAEGKE